MGRADLTLEEKRSLVRDGFVVIRDVVPLQLTGAARRAIYLDAQTNGFRAHSHDTGIDGVLADLVNKSPLGVIMSNAMGPYDAPERGFAATLYPEPEHDLPNFGWRPHLDGIWYSPDVPALCEVDSWQAPRTHHFGDSSAAVQDASKTLLFQDPARTVSIGSFTAFVGVALTDQSEFGRGNLCALARAHELVERFFRYQRDNGGPVGPEGPGWPRLSPSGDGGAEVTLIPPGIRDLFRDDAVTTEDGTLWLKPMPVLMEEGDAVVMLHACPHDATSNFGADPRMNAYFRLRHRRPGGARVRGDSDHPDRGWDGEFLDYPDGHDPWQAAVAAMCDHWSEWAFATPEFLREVSEEQA